MRFSVFADYLDRVEQTPSRLEMIGHLAELFKECKSDTITVKQIAYLCQGTVAPDYEGVELGIGERLMLDAVVMATGYSKAEVEKEYKKLGDLGSVVEKLAGKKRQSTLLGSALTISKVFSNFKSLAEMRGSKSQAAKIKLLSELLLQASPLEARYIVRIPLGRLRLGMGTPTIIEALALAFFGARDRKEEVETAYNVRPDIGWVAETMIENPKRIENAEPELFIPVRPALAERLPSADAVFERLGPCYADGKYDGLRMQVHKKGQKIEIFSRRMERMTRMFPDIVEGIKQLNIDNFIIEGEALAYNEKEKRYYSFQETMRRKRKHGIAEKQDELPLKVFIFDILQMDGESYINKPYKERRKAIEKRIKENDRIRHSECDFVESAKELQKLFDSALKKGLEGLIAKDPNMQYVAGARKFAWIKLKRSYGELADTVDLAVVGYYRGKGHRAQFEFGGLLGAVYNEERGMFETIARVGSGFTEEEMKEMKERLEKIQVKTQPKNLDARIEPHFWVSPKYVISVTSDEITLSPTHTCNITGMGEGDKGFALRFPRMVEFRKDKGPLDATTTKEIEEMFQMQRELGKKRK